MIWFWSIIIFPLFYFFAILQTSFLIYFNLFGSIPNLIFVLFFISIFYTPKNNYYFIIFVGLLAGIFLDIISISQFGISIILLIIIGLLIKKIQFLLKDNDNGYSLFYFLVIFLGSLLIYNLVLQNLSINLINSLIELVYSSVFAIFGFFIVKKVLKNRKSNKIF
jgi:cell shape-determining protein MreD